MRFSLDWLTNNLGLKIISLFLAIGFWFYAIGEESIEITRSVPLKIEIANDKLSEVSRSVDSLRVTFSAPRQLASNLMSENITAAHRVEGMKGAGNYTFAVTPQDISVNYPEVKISKIIPLSVTVSLDELIVKKLAVKANLDGEPAFGYRVDTSATELDPNTVLVQGPKSVLEKLDSIPTDPIQLVGRIRSFRRTTAIQKNPKIKILGDGIADVQISILPEFSEKTFAKISVRPLGNPASERYVVLDAKQTELILKGPSAVLDKLDPATILAFVDVEGLKEGEYNLSVKVILPPDLTLKGDSPKVPVLIRKIKA